ncbi:Gfo/Idh/MocA family protein [Actinocrispum wychmicini]|uniref:Oxidoreductase family protein n=1 Tax=Actinocrispum wychmicini TaxID=1213861 RepID=A0A4R2JB04_9PSEU|nr:Gfo/Idh/MocA family oxidoreductase [Actinocrispum wychmicini]TCO53189.1 oxidoreductase family protein [Actinocrispum wychmicini]
MSAYPVRVAILGAGVRGQGHSQHIRRHGGRITAIAEPDDQRRQRLAAEHDVPPEACFTDWRALAEHPELADAVVITTQDNDHAEPCVRFADLGRHILCEKPMATTEPDAARMVAAVERTGVIFAVVHPLRYMPYTDTIRNLVDEGHIGHIVNVQHLEPVGAWHFAHSYVRGHWRREDLSSSLLMAKCCHDLDWLSYIIQAHPVRVASFGRLTHFRSDNHPPGAAHRCLDCAIEPDCPFSAPRLYRSCLGDPARERWPLSVVTDTPAEDALTHALTHGPYGRCVYTCDNDVVDHQVVALDFANGVTATHTVTAFTDMARRQTRIFGTHGSIDSDGHQITLQDFRAHPATRTTTIHPDRERQGTASHGDGDQAAVAAFLTAVATGDTSHIRSGPQESLDSHRAVWAAEHARRTNTTVTMLRG